MMPLLYASELILVDATIKTTILLALTAGAALLARRASASVRHILWTTGLSCALILPMLSIALPHWNAHVPTSSPLKAIAIQSSDSDGGRLTPPSGAQSAYDGIDSDATTPISQVRTPHSSVAPALPASHSTAQPVAFWLIALIITWMSGAVLVLGRILQGIITTCRLKQGSQAVTLGPLRDAAVQVTARMPAGRDVEIRIADSATDIKVPITWGARYPKIMLPAGSASWPHDRVRAALLHELAHVRRWDWLLHMMAGVACAMYWFHPLVWLAARKMRQESETACDDLVVLAGIPATDYARHLLNVAMSARNPSRIGLGAVAMAQTPKVEGRLRVVLATGLSRHPATRRMAFGALAAGLICVLPLGALRLMATPDSVNAGAEPGTEIKRLAYGGEVKLLGVTYFPAAGKAAWNTSGAIVPNPVLPQSNGGYLSAQKGWKLRQFVFQTAGVSADASYIFSAADSTSSISYVAQTADGRKHLKLSANFPDTAPTATIRVGVADKPWETISRDSRTGGEMSSTSSGSDGQTVAISPSSMLGAKVCFTISDNIRDKDTRVIALDNGGNILSSSTIRDSQVGAIHQRTIAIEVPTVEKIKELRFQTRPYEWLDFTNIPLQPSPEGTIQADKASSPQGEPSKQVEQAMQLRDHLQGWAKKNRSTLLGMQRAQAGNFAIVAQICSSLDALPFPLWDGDPRTGQNNGEPAFSFQYPHGLALSRLQHSQALIDRIIRETFQQYHDVRLASSLEPGRSRICLWASGRITKTTTDSQFAGHGKPFKVETHDTEIVKGFLEE